MIYMTAEQAEEFGIITANANVTILTEDEMSDHLRNLLS